MTNKLLNMKLSISSGIFLFCACLLACSNNKSYEGDATEISVPLIKPEKTPYPPVERIRNNMDTIYLETNDSCLVGNIKDVRVDDDLIFIRTDNRILLFSYEGTFIHSFAHRGRGAGEYLNIQSFDLSPEREELYIFDRDIRKIQVYSYNNNYLRTISLEDYPFDFAVLSSGDLLLFYPQNFPDQLRRGLWKADCNGNVKKQLIELDPKFKRVGIIDHYMVHLDDKTIGLMGLEDNDLFYHITADTVYESYHMTTDIRMSRRVTRSDDIIETPLTRYYKLNYLESDNWLMFLASDGKTTEANVFVDKTDNTTYRLYNNDYLEYIKSPQDIIPYFTNSFMGKYVSYIDPSIICGVPEARDLLFPSLKAEDNPVLLILHDK